MKTTNRKLIGITAIVAVAVCIAAALVIFSKGSSTKRGAAETDGFTEEAATVDRVLYADEMAAISYTLEAMSRIMMRLTVQSQWSGMCWTRQTERQRCWLFIC